MTSNEVKLFDGLKDRFGKNLILETDSFSDYSRDASEITFKPEAILFAESEREVIEAVNYCRRHNIPVVFRGAGTGYSGGAVPVMNGLVLSLERLKYLRIFPEDKMAFCGPGVITIELMNKAGEFGLFYPPDPASYDESTLGGNVAECAGGLHCKKYGVTKDYIIGLKTVTADGKILKTGVYSDADLFDLSGILIGSEGLLGAVTEIAVRLIDLPQIGPTILAAFEKPEDAAHVVAEITRQGLIPSVMEYMDGDAIACSIAYEKAVDIANAEAVLLFETTGVRALEEAEKIEILCRKHGTSLLRKESDHTAGEKLWKIRRNLSKAVKASAKQKTAEDVCVPSSKLPELVAFVLKLNQEFPIRINSYGHAGDGNLHVNFLTESSDMNMEKVINEGVERLFKKTLQLGGTLTGEHGIGLSKKNYLHLEFDPPTLSSMKSIKSAFDPSGLLNPGKMFAQILEY